MDTNIIVAAIPGLLMIGAGMAGLYFQLPLSGWVLAVGLLMIGLQLLTMKILP